MVSLFKRKENAVPKDLTEFIIDEQAKTELAMTEIKGTSHLVFRTKIIEELCARLINERLIERDSLINVPKKTEYEIKKIERLDYEIMSLELRRALNTAGVPFAGSGDKRDVAKRIRAFEQLFWLGWNDPECVTLVAISAMYNLDVTFLESHGRPSPTIIAQSMNRGGYRFDLSSGGAKTETVKSDKSDA